jgi:leucyl aminopeptidase (aminopeptidase T)
MKAAMTAARWCLDIQPGETVLIVTDTEISPLIYYTLAGAIHTMGGIPVISLMRPLPYASAEPPTAVAEAMKSCDIIINCASRTITHSAARHEAQFRHGKRVLVMPAMTEDMLIRGAGAADFEVVKDITGKVVEFLGSGRSVRVTSKHGTDVTFSIDGRPAKPAHGQIRPPELLSVFPGGETPLCPVDGSVNGQIVIDSYMLDVGLVDRPIIWTVKQGQVVDIKGGHAADALLRILEVRGDEYSRYIGEFSVGTNYAARPIGNNIEDKQVYGSVHFAIGTGSSYPPYYFAKYKSSIHLDGVILKPDVFVDDRALITNGEIVIAPRPKDWIASQYYGPDLSLHP